MRILFQKKYYVNYDKNVNTTHDPGEKQRKQSTSILRDVQNLRCQSSHTPGFGPITKIHITSPKIITYRISYIIGTRPTYNISLFLKKIKHKKENRYFQLKNSQNCYDDLSASFSNIESDIVV